VIANVKRYARFFRTGDLFNGLICSQKAYVDQT